MIVGEILLYDLLIYSVGAHIQLEIDLYLKSIENKEDKRLREMIFNCLLKRETCITGCHTMDEIGEPCARDQ
jgi:spermine oxidase